MIARVSAWYLDNKQDIYIASLVVLMVIIACIPFTFVTINPGYEAVEWNRFFSGTNMKQAYPEGTRLKWPWDRMYLYDTRLQRTTNQYFALTNNGIKVSVEVAFRHRPNVETLPQLHKYVGENYVDVLILPKIGSHIRELVAQYQPEELYSTDRTKIEQQLFLAVRNDSTNIDVGSKNPQEAERLMQYVFFENIYITAIHLPERVKQAIEAKEAVKQKALAYEHQLEIARQEKIRKRIEAEGVRDFQNTVNEGISDKYLKWKGIEATLELAQSDNSKVVVIGSGKDGLPIILGGDYTQTPPTTGGTGTPATVPAPTSNTVIGAQQQLSQSQKQADKNMKVVNNNIER